MAKRSSGRTTAWCGVHSQMPLPSPYHEPGRVLAVERLLSHAMVNGSRYRWRLCTAAVAHVTPCVSGFEQDIERPGAWRVHIWQPATFTRTEVRVTREDGVLELLDAYTRRGARVQLPVFVHPVSSVSGAPAASLDLLREREMAMAAHLRRRFAGGRRIVRLVCTRSRIFA